MLTAAVPMVLSQPPPPIPPVPPTIHTDGVFRGDLPVTIEGQGGVISVTITNNTVDGNLIVRIINNKNVKKIEVLISENTVYKNLILEIKNNELDNPQSKNIDCEVLKNKVGGELKVTESNNFVLKDLNTDVIENKAGKFIRVSIGSGKDEEDSEGNLVSNMKIKVNSNTACELLSVSALENTIDLTMVADINNNSVSENIDIDISQNKRPPRFKNLFTGLSITIENNHVVYKDIKIKIFKNQLADTGSPMISIDIKNNGARGEIDISITKNLAQPGKITINILDNVSDSEMKVVVQSNKANKVTITIKDNHAYSAKPNISSQKPAIVEPNTIKDFQMRGMTDSDGDGLTNEYEKRVIGTDPSNEDTDSDGLYDGWNDDGDLKFQYTPSGFFSEGFGEFGDPREVVGYQRNNKGSLSNLFNNRNEKPSPICQDVYVEVDFMPGTRISARSFRSIKDAFSQQLIHIHIDNGWAIGPLSQTRGGQMVNDLNTIMIHDSDVGPLDDFSDYKQTYFDVHRTSIFHYALIGHIYTETPGSTGANPGSSAQGNPVSGSDFFIADTNVIRYSRSLGSSRNTARAGIFMHELGHNFGLVGDGFSTAFDQTVFGGIDNLTTFPLNASYNASAFANYQSVMNYRYTLSGPIDYSDGLHGTDDFDDWENINLRRIIDYP
jgi:hypothetical protein